MKPFHHPWYELNLRIPSRAITEPTEYRGAKNVRIDYPDDVLYRGNQTLRKRLIAGWCEFFGRPSPLRNLWIGFHVTEPLFLAICQRRELEGLSINGGRFHDLSPIRNLRSLRQLHLGVSGIESIAPLSSLRQLESLHLERLYKSADYSPLGKLSRLESLCIRGDENDKGSVPIANLRFLKNLKALRVLYLEIAKLLDGDYTPIARLKSLERLELPTAAEPEADKFSSSLPNLRHLDFVPCI